MQHSSLAGQVVELVATAFLKARMHEAVRSYSAEFPCRPGGASHEADRGVSTAFHQHRPASTCVLTLESGQGARKEICDRRYLWNGLAPRRSALGRGRNWRHRYQQTFGQQRSCPCPAPCCFPIPGLPSAKNTITGGVCEPSPKKLWICDSIHLRTCQIAHDTHLLRLSNVLVPRGQEEPLRVALHMATDVPSNLYLLQRCFGKYVSSAMASSSRGSKP